MAGPRPLQQVETRDIGQDVIDEHDRWLVLLGQAQPLPRIVRSEVLSLRQRPYVDAAIAGGSSRARILRRHLLPAIVPQAALSAVLLVPHAVWHETALSFLGLGLPPHLASIGNILGDGRDAVLLGAWWIVLFPSLLLVATTLAVSGLAATWRDRLVPRRRSELVL